MAPGVPGWFLPVSHEAVLIEAGSADNATALQLRSLPPVLANTSFLVLVRAVGPSVVASAARSEVGVTSISGGTTPAPVSATAKTGWSGSLEATFRFPVQGAHGAVGVKRTVTSSLASLPSATGKLGVVTSV